MKVAFQGEAGAYSEAAALEHFGGQITTVPCESFDAVFAAVDNRLADCGLVPIENSLAGSIHRNYDLLLQHNLPIIGEHYLRVHHCLIAHPGVTIGEIRKVISHPQGLAQCERFLRSLPGVVSEQVYDTAGSVKIVRQQGDRSMAAIASRRAAEVYGMAILVEGVEDDPANYTRFLAIAPQPATPGAGAQIGAAGAQNGTIIGEAKTSIVFTLRNMPGSLFKALSVFALRDIDLTKIESRPLVGRPWEYLFYIDCIGATSDPTVQRALDHLEEYALMLRVLGSYRRATPPNGDTHDGEKHG